jgi:hypothetical protein
MRLLFLTLRTKAFRPVTASFLSFRGLPGSLLGVGWQCKANFWYLSAFLCSIRSVQLSFLFLIWSNWGYFPLCLIMQSSSLDSSRSYISAGSVWFSFFWRITIHFRRACDRYAIYLSLVLHTQDDVSNHEYRFAGGRYSGQCSSRFNHLLCLRLLVFALLSDTVTITSVSPYTKKCTKHLGVLWYVACGRWRLSPPEHYKGSSHSSINQEF